MAIYSVHSKGDPERDAIFVRDGFSWAAFIFTVLWALWNRMWIVAVVLFAAMIGISAIGTWFGLHETAVSIINMAVGLLFGMEAQDLRRWSLARRGYHETGITAGDGLEDAELRFFLSQTSERISYPPAPVPIFRPQHGSGHEPLGLFNAAG
jgi:hypothetical protein